MRKIIEGVFPFIGINRATKIINEVKSDIEAKVAANINTPTMDSFQGVTLDDANYLYKMISENMKSLVDKAKTTTVAVTLSFTLFGGISTYLLNIKDKFIDNLIINISIVFLVLISLFYLISCGWFSLKALNSRQNYDLSPEEFSYLASLSGNEDNMNEEKILLIARSYEYKLYDNLIVNNFVDSSNLYLRNSLISLGVLVALICSTFIYPNTNKNDNLQTELLAVKMSTDAISKDVLLDQNNIIVIMARLDELDKRINQMSDDLKKHGNEQKNETQTLNELKLTVEALITANNRTPDK